METGCCPKSDPKLWDGKRLVCKNKPFAKESAFTRFITPINFGAVTSKVYGKVQASLWQTPTPL